MFLEQLEEKRPELYLDLNIIILESQCYMINDLLLSKNLFLHVFKKTPTINEVKERFNGLCVKERFNGFQVVRHLFDKEEEENF